MGIVRLVDGWMIRCEAVVRDGSVLVMALPALYSIYAGKFLVKI
jgi:hypothetical protein